VKSLLQEAPPAAAGERRLVGRLVLALLFLVAALVGATIGLLFVYSTDLPQVEQLEHFRPSSTTELYDDQGRIIGSFALQRRVVASYNDYPPVLRDALISIEDKDFYRHGGVNVWRIVGAASRDIESGGKVQGASTLTMQLARNLFLSPDRHWQRKVQEAMLAIQIERRFTKPQIFTLYANQIALGHGVFGFEAASEFYTSLDVELQKAANQAILDGLAAYERRHGWKGHLENVVGDGEVIKKYSHPDWDDEPEVGGYVHALVTSAGPGIATLKFGRYTAALGQADVAWTKHKLADILKTSDVCYVKIVSLGANGAAKVGLEQDSGAQSALIAIDNAT